jgi:RNase P subunit RPR2
MMTDHGKGEATLTRIYCPSCRRWSLIGPSLYESSVRVSPGRTFECAECGKTLQLKIEVQEDNDG